MELFLMGVGALLRLYLMHNDFFKNLCDGTIFSTPLSSWKRGEPILGMTVSFCRKSHLKLLCIHRDAGAGGQWTCPHKAVEAVRVPPPPPPISVRQCGLFLFLFVFAGYLGSFPKNNAPNPGSF